MVDLGGKSRGSRLLPPVDRASCNLEEFLAQPATDTYSAAINWQ
jgi:hypothetical protein